MKINRESVWENSTVVELERFLIHGVPAKQADISTITRKIFDLHTSPPTLIDSSNPVVNDTIFDTLQDWEKDNIGYNFRDGIEHTHLSEGGHIYRVEYLIVKADDTRDFIIWEHLALELYSV